MKATVKDFNLRRLPYDIHHSSYIPFTQIAIFQLPQHFRSQLGLERPAGLECPTNPQWREDRILSTGGVGHGP